MIILVQKENYTSKENISCAFSTVIKSVLLHKVKTNGILHYSNRSEQWEELEEERKGKSCLLIQVANHKEQLKLLSCHLSKKYQERDIK